MRWFRMYIGTMRDPKLVGIAARSRQPLERVAFYWCCALESAAEREAGGAFDMDGDALAYTLRCDPADLAVIRSEMEHAGMIADGVIARWKDRQFESDNSTDRVRDFRKRDREKKRQELLALQHHGNVDETLQQQHVTSSEAEPESESEAKPAGLDVSILEKCLAAIGRASDAAPPAMASATAIAGWIAAGADLELDVLPTLRAKGATLGGKRARTWQWFDKAIAEARERRKKGSRAPASVDGEWIGVGDPLWSRCHSLKPVVALESRSYGGRGYFFDASIVAKARAAA